MVEWEVVVDGIGEDSEAAVEDEDEEEDNQCQCPELNTCADLKDPVRIWLVTWS